MSGERSHFHEEPGMPPPSDTLSNVPQDSRVLQVITTLQSFHSILPYQKLYTVTAALGLLARDFSQETKPSHSNGVQSTGLFL